MKKKKKTVEQFTRMCDDPTKRHKERIKCNQLNALSSFTQFSFFSPVFCSHLSSVLLFCFFCSVLRGFFLLLVSITWHFMFKRNEEKTINEDKKIFYFRHFSVRFKEIIFLYHCISFFIISFCELFCFRVFITHTDRWLNSKSIQLYC